MALLQIRRGPAGAPAGRLPIALINPPLANITQPFVALAALQAHLRANGFASVRIWNVSQTLVNRMLTEGYLAETAAALEATIECAEARLTLDLDGALRYDRAVVGLAAARAAGPRVREAVATLRDPARFYDVAAYQRAMEALDLAFTAISGRFFPQQLTETSYVASATQDLDDEAEVRAFVTDPARCLWHGQYLDGVVDDICATAPRLVGLSATFHDQFLPALVLARLLKARLPDAHVVLGGAFVSTRRECLRERPWLFDYVDSVSVYEGETPLLSLARALEGGDALDAVPNLYRRVDGAVREPASVSTERLADLASPDYTGYDIRDYLAPGWDVIYDPTRGCYWNKCTFCAVSLSTRRTDSRGRDASRIVDDIERLCEAHATDVITFGVDAIPVPLMRGVCEEIVRRRLDVGWSSEFILDKGLTSDTVALFAEAGCLLLLFGLESANARVLKLMKKGNLLDRSERILRDCRRHGVGVLLHLMVGFPSETEAEVERTVSFVEGVADAVDLYEINGFGLVDETPVWGMLDELGVARVGRQRRLFQAWSERPYAVREGVTPAWVEAALPALRERLDRALGLEGRRHLRWDNAHLHLYLKRLRRRPRELGAEAAPRERPEVHASGFDLAAVRASARAIVAEREAAWWEGDLEAEAARRGSAHVRFMRGARAEALVRPSDDLVLRLGAVGP